MSRSIYEQIESGKWYPLTKQSDVACCDCGLVHDVSIRVRNGKAQTRAAGASASERATVVARRVRLSHNRAHVNPTSQFARSRRALRDLSEAHAAAHDTLI